MEAYAWILYANPMVHHEEVRLIRNAGLENFIHIQDVRLNKGPMPEWLNVLPALADTEKRLVYRGPSCMRKLVAIDLPPEHLKRLAKKRIV